MSAMTPERSGLSWSIPVSTTATMPCEFCIWALFQLSSLTVNALLWSAPNAELLLL